MSRSLSPYGQGVAVPCPPILSQADLNSLIAEARAAFARDRDAGQPWTAAMIEATQAAIRECQAELDTRPRYYSRAHVADYQRAVAERQQALERIAA